MEELGLCITMTTEYTQDTEMIRNTWPNLTDRLCSTCESPETTE